MDKLLDSLMSKNGRYLYDRRTAINLLLTANSIKPGTDLCLSIINFKSLNKNDFKILNDKLDFHSKLASELDLIYFHELRYEYDGKRIILDTYLSKDAQHLETIMGNTSHEYQGKFHGFPQECIDSFCGKNLPRFTGSDMSNSIFEAIEHDVPIPVWLAYISHVPEKLDLINNDISKSSEALGLKYQNFIREKYPYLASKVENSFFREYSKDKTPIMDKLD